MEDSEIVALYWRRDQAAIQETQRSYGRYLEKIAFNILSNREDGEEVVNDTCLKAWNSIPPNWHICGAVFLYGLFEGGRGLLRPERIQGEKYALPHAAGAENLFDTGGI